MLNATLRALALPVCLLLCWAPAVGAERVTLVSNGATLVGTFSAATGAGRHPAVVLLAGSGKATRDSVPFRTLTTFFNSAGVGVLAYDKRGSGESGGVYDDNTPLELLASDGLAAVTYLKSRPDVDARRIGVWGISQGGWVGPLMASMSANVAFVISVSGPGVSIAEQAIYFRRGQMLEQGFSLKDAEEAEAYRRVTWAYFGTGLGRDAAQAALDTYKDRPWFKKLALPPTLSTPDKLDPALRAFMESAAAYDPLAVAQTLKVPVLSIFGAKDSTLPVSSSLQNLIQAYARGGNRRAEFILIPNAGHGMELVTGDVECHDCSEKAMAESGQWNTAPGFFEAMNDWLKRTLNAA